MGAFLLVSGVGAAAVAAVPGATVNPSIEPALAQAKEAST
jgi:hypothetical protein